MQKATQESKVGGELPQSPESAINDAGAAEAMQPGGAAQGCHSTPIVCSTASLLWGATRRRPIIITAILIPVIASAFYVRWTARESERRAAIAAEPSGTGAPWVSTKQAEQRIVRTREDLLREGLGEGKFYLKARRADEAIAAYERAYQLGDGRSAAAALGLGEALAMRAGQKFTDESGRLFEEAIALAPHDPQALLAAGLAAAYRGDSALARQRWQELLGMHPAPELVALLEVRMRELDDPIVSTSRQPAE